MPDNLTIQISADSSKARADIELLKAQLRAANKEVRDLASAGAKAGDVLPSARLQTAAAHASALDKQIKTLNQTFVRTSSVVDVLATKSMRRLLTQFDNVGKSASNIAMVMGAVTGSFAGGFLAASVFAGIAKLIDQLDAVSERIKKIGAEAAKTGQKPLAVQGAQEIALGKGRPADAFSASMGAIAEAAAKMQTEGGAFTGGVKVMRGSMAEATDEAKKLGSEMKGGIAVYRGSSPLVLDLAKVYDTLGVSMKGVTDSTKLLEKQKEVFKAFQDQAKRFNPIQLNEMAKALKFESSTEALKLIPAFIADIDKKIQELAKSSRGATANALLSEEDVDASKERLNKWFRETLSAEAQWRRDWAIAMNGALADFLEGIPGFFKGITDALTALWTTAWANLKANSEQAYKDFTTAWAPLGEFFTTLFDGVMSAAGRALDWILEKARGVVEAIRSVQQQVTDPSKPYAIPPMASGGMVRGPGSGTSDSILARLSNGEFVMRAAAVNKWGPQFMAALNSMRNPFGYAGGGLVRPRFAAGGMVQARTADGVTVNLTFPGGTFALRGDAAIVGGLTREARRAGMLSAGRLAAAIN